MDKAERDNLTSQILYGGKWETYKGKSVPAGHAARMAEHEASKKKQARKTPKTGVKKGDR